MTKKGQASSFLPFILIGIVVLFIFAIVALPIAHVGDKVFSSLQEEGRIGESEKANQSVQQVENLVTPAFDQLVFIILVSILIGGIVIAIFTEYHPVILAIFIIAVVLLVLISGLIANAYEEVENTDILKNKSKEFNMTSIIMGEQLPVIVAVFGTVSILILLAKRGQVAGG